MVHQSAFISDLQAAWETWYLTEFDFRSACLEQMAQQVRSSHPSIAGMFDYHCRQAKLHAGGCDELFGATGETNELYTTGRGISVIVQKSSDGQAQLSVFAMVATALLTGNTVMLCTDDQSTIDLVNQMCSSENLPANIIKISACDTYHAMLDEEIRVLGIVGSKEAVTRLNQQLAQRSGALVQYVFESDVDNIPCAKDPYLSLRFVTERTRTINITAIGGNASLLELGSDGH
jgi:delta 1-pyrroline-5-carboxylate dehydrogenase